MEDVAGRFGGEGGLGLGECVINEGDVEVVVIGGGGVEVGVSVSGVGPDDIDIIAIVEGDGGFGLFGGVVGEG